MRSTKKKMETKRHLNDMCSSSTSDIVKEIVLLLQFVYLKCFVKPIL